MGPTGKSYNDVKAILGKLDRHIDDARSRRLHTGPASSGPDQPVNSAASAVGGSMAGGLGMNGRAAANGADAAPATASPYIGAVPSQPPTATRPGSVYGRAQPLRPSGT